MSEQVVCACGCGKVITERDNHPWFKLRSCQQVWMATREMSEPDRAQWMWDQRFYFTTLNFVSWDSGVDWDYEYTDQMIVSYANARLEEARSALVPLDGDDPDALADALRILTHWSYMSQYTGVWMGHDKLPAWVFTERRVHRRSRAAAAL